MTVQNYITEDEFRAYIRDTTTVDADAINNAIDSASRRVEGICGRHFYQHTDVQYFSPDPGNLWRLKLDDMDLATTDGLTVQCEFDNTGTYSTTYAFGTDFIAQPINQSVNGIEDWPFTELQTLGKIWPMRVAGFYRDTVKVTGTWGWPAIPAAVKRATAIIAVQQYKQPADAPFGYVGLNGWGPTQVKGTSNAVLDMLQPYKKHTTLMMA